MSNQDPNTKEERNPVKGEGEEKNSPEGNDGDGQFGPHRECGVGNSLDLKAVGKNTIL